MVGWAERSEIGDEQVQLAVLIQIDHLGTGRVGHVCQFVDPVGTILAEADGQHRSVGHVGDQ